MFNQAIKQITRNLDQELYRLERESVPIHHKYDTESHRIMFFRGDEKISIKPLELRKKCECALCYDEMTGKKLLNEQTIPENVFPHTMAKKGNYAIAITWSDGHKSSIYPYEKVFNMNK